jgi:hypothetical protein
MIELVNPMSEQEAVMLKTVQEGGINERMTMICLQTDIYDYDILATVRV